MNKQDEKLLNDYLDGGLDAEARAALEARMDNEPALRREYAALSEVVTAVGALPAEAQPTDPDALWGRIAERTGAGAGEDVAVGASVRSVTRWDAARRWRYSLPRLAAAGLVATTIFGAAAWLVLGTPGFGPSEDERAKGGALLVPGTPEASAVFAGAADPGVAALFEGYEASAKAFARILEDGATALSPETLDAVREALAVADQAIAQARRALEEDPGSEELTRILFANMKRRLELLRSTAAAVQSAA